MKTAELTPLVRPLTDALGQSWTLGPKTGRGLFATTWSVKDSHGREHVLKAAFTAADLAEVPLHAATGANLAALSRAAFDEQLELLKSRRHEILPPLVATLKLADGTPAYVLPKLVTFERKVQGGASLREILGVTHKVAHVLHRQKFVHGNLHVGNILFHERGELALTDVLTPSAVKLRLQLRAVLKDRADDLPPEASAPHFGWDSWALCALLYRAAIHGPVSGTGPRLPLAPLPRAGFDKLEQATLTDRAFARFTAERALPRFAGRVAQSLARVVVRGLSPEHQPSPPYRFLDAREFLARIEDLEEMIDPRVTDVGKLLLARNARDAVFQGGEDVGFAVAVGCSGGIADHEDIACGIQFRDIDAPGDNRLRLPEMRFTVGKQESGRLRFEFKVGTIPPGRYAVKAAFWVKDSGQEPQVAAGQLEVRPPPGYVPPMEDQGEEPSSTLRFPGQRKVAMDDDLEPTEAVPSSANREPPSDPGEHDADSEPGAEVIEGLFPRPIAPARRERSLPPPQMVEIEEEPTANYPRPSLSVVDPGSDPGFDELPRAVAPRPAPTLAVVRPGLAMSPSIAAPRPAPVQTIAPPKPSGPPKIALGVPKLSVMAADPPSRPEFDPESEEIELGLDEPMEFADSLLPGQGDTDLTGMAEAGPRRTPDLFQKGFDALLRNSVILAVVAMGGCFAALMILMSILKALS